MQIQIRLLRNRNGISVNVQTAPSVELLFRDTSAGQEPLEVLAFGRYWSPLKEGTTLLAYPLDQQRIAAMGSIPGSGINWTLNAVGQPLFIGEKNNRRYIGKDDPDAVNLSMLRLKGISEPGGITFVYHDILSEEQMKDLAEDLHQCSAYFYNAFLRDFDVTLRVSKED